ncbi:MAG TPA: hypothetical protein VNJ04_14585 [Gemmatimonadaceae bacterium]|nr:hypothetical protein [Gemmatimonadaceae bacterium]
MLLALTALWVFALSAVAVDLFAQWRLAVAAPWLLIVLTCAGVWILEGFRTHTPGGVVSAREVTPTQRNFALAIVGWTSVVALLGFWWWPRELDWDALARQQGAVAEDAPRSPFISQDPSAAEPAVFRGDEIEIVGYVPIRERKTWSTDMLVLWLLPPLVIAGAWFATLWAKDVFPNVRQRFVPPALSRREWLIVFGVLLVTAALAMNALTSRYEIRAGSGMELLRVDRWTGRVSVVRTRTGQWQGSE